MDHSTFYTFAAIIAIAVLAGLVANRLKQPVLVAFVAIGILVGPVGIGWVSSEGELEIFSQLGIAVLLFLVGLKLDIKLIKTTGPVALATGLGQVFFTSVVGYVIAIALGFDSTSALYIAIALTFSSTIIIVKLLSDKREIDQLHGKIAIGFLIVQDIVVILVMIGLTAFAGNNDGSVAEQALQVIGKGFGLIVATFLFTKYLLTPLLHVAAKSRELLVLFAIAWAISVASLTDWLGFSTEVGAFIAGLAIASTTYREAIGASLLSLRNFLLLFFFLGLGASLEFTDAGEQMVPALIFSAFVLVGNPIIVLIIMRAMKYPTRVSFFAGLTVAQISEFSLILAALGLSLGHIENATVGLITVVGLITISLSTYLILYSQEIYSRIKPLLKIFEPKVVKDVREEDERAFDVIMYGHGRFGSQIAKELSDKDKTVLIVDYDPDVVGLESENQNIESIYGDAEDLDLLEHLPLDRAKWVICTIPSPDINIALSHELKRHNFKGQIALMAHNSTQADQISKVQPDQLMEPFKVGAKEITDIIVSS